MNKVLWIETWNIINIAARKKEKNEGLNYTSYS